MSRLEWFRNEDGWRAGRYEIDLAAPGLWVCSRRYRSRPHALKIEMTSGSLSALKARVETLETRRVATRRFGSYLLATLVSLLIVALGAGSASGAAPYVVFGFGCASLVFLIRAIDTVVQRSWESLRLTYQ